MTDQHSSDRLRVAIVGAGPAGFYTAAAILKSEPGSTVNLIERLPTPWGLLRAGVAPDHQNIRALGKAFDKIAQTPGLNLLGNVEVGIDITHHELTELHHAVVYATGAPLSRPLGIPGEHLSGVHPAGDLVGWYNAHPDFVHVRPDLAGHRAVVVGNGNVALDLARMLMRRPEELAATDTASHAQTALAAKGISEVVVLGRRGPEQAGFTFPELKEISRLPDVDLVVDPADLSDHDDAASDTAALSDDCRRRMELLRATAQSTPQKADGRRIVLKFYAQPVRITGERGVTGIEVARTRLDSEHRAHLTGERDYFEAGLVTHAIGFASQPLDGVSFDVARARISNSEGRVHDSSGCTALNGIYTAGWAKRGPSGVIGTNKKDAAETAASLLSDFHDGQLPTPTRAADDLTRIVQDRGGTAVTLSGWQRIDTAEQAAGTAAGSPRVKFVDRKEMLRIAVET